MLLKKKLHHDAPVEGSRNQHDTMAPSYGKPGAEIRIADTSFHPTLRSAED
jgi:hypothetical protein